MEISGETLVLPELPLSHEQNDCGSIRRIKTALKGRMIRYIKAGNRHNVHKPISMQVP